MLTPSQQEALAEELNRGWCNQPRWKRRHVQMLEDLLPNAPEEDANEWIEYRLFGNTREMPAWDVPVAMSVISVITRAGQ